jgi:hypothetical protein
MADMHRRWERFPIEWWQIVACCWSIDGKGLAFPSHVEVCHLKYKIMMVNILKINAMEKNLKITPGPGCW